MAIRYTLPRDGNMLLVTASGFDETLEEVQAYGMAIIQTCLDDGYTRVLCDERTREYRLGTLDIYRAAEFVATYATQVVKVAIVCDQRFSADARFWEDVAINRGLTARFFKDITAARTWLCDETAGQTSG